MLIHIEIAVQEAVKAGKTAAGWLPVEVSEADLASWSQAQRDALAVGLRTVEGQLRYTPTWHTSEIKCRPIVEATLGALIALLDYSIAQGNWIAAQNAERKAREEAAREQEIQYLLAFPVEKWVGLNSFGRYDVIEGRRHYADPRIAPLYAEAQALAKRLDEEQQAKLAAEEEAEKQAAAALVAKLEAAKDAWVQEHGTESQKARLAAGVLPESDLVNAIRAQKFAALAEAPRYERITSADLVCNRNDEGDLDHEKAPAFEAEDVTELTEDQFNALGQIKAMSPPSSIVQARVHTARCRECDARTSRWSALVTLDWFGLHLSREYALPDGAEETDEED